MFVGGMRVVETSIPLSPQGYHLTVVARTGDFPALVLTVTSVKIGSEHFHFTAQVSAPSLLSARVQSGAICWIRGPVGTENAKVDEYSNLEYLAWVAFIGQATNCAGDRQKW
jgi:hypothetical protein